MARIDPIRLAQEDAERLILKPDLGSSGAQILYAIVDTCEC